MNRHLYYFTVNSKTGDYRFDGTYESAASYRRHLAFIMDREDFEDWTPIIKDSHKEPFSLWEINLTSTPKKRGSRNSS